MIAIISDVHGNLPALTSVLAEIDRMGVERIACLGDVAGYYCSINECVEALRARDIVNLMGNHDYYLTSGTDSPRSTSANRCLDYQRRTITEDNLRWLAASPLRGVADGVSMVHAGWNDPIDEYLYDVRPEYFHAFEGTRFASGHTHIQGVWEFEAKIYCNPGSVGQPRDGDPRAAFAVWADGTPTLCRVAYDIDETSRRMERAGFEPYFYENLYRGTRIGAGREGAAGSRSRGTK
jgi:diadenosine tetraphosphatase ApaH/serine/threonine PP2A family protein phosphatase